MIEAGVDVDFPVVYRDLGPLDRIVQVAGRCNREGKFDGLGRCVVVRLEESSAPQGPYKTAIDITGPILAEYGSRLDAPEAMATYSRDLFLFTETGSLRCPNDRATVQKLREEFNFATVARTFGLIEDDTTPVIVECYQGENIDIPALIAEWETCPNGWFRRVAPFAVNLFNRDLTRLQRDGLVHQHDSGAYIYSGRYDYTFGLGLDVSDPSDLIA